MGFSFVSEVICKIYLRVAWGSFLWILKDVHVMNNLTNLTSFRLMSLTNFTSQMYTCESFIRELEIQHLLAQNCLPQNCLLS